MKRFVLMVIATVTSLMMMAVGRNDGSTKANAIDFDWEKGCEQQAGTRPVWYRIDLDRLYEEENPTLAVYVTNLEETTATVVVKATLMGQTEERTYSIKGGDMQIWTANAAALVKMQQKELYLTFKANKKVRIAGSVYETSDVDEECLKATAFDWTNGNDMAAGEAWYKVDLTNVIADADTEVELSLENLSTASARVEAGISLDCPSTGLTRYETTLGGKQKQSKVLSRAMISMLADPVVYIKLNSNQPLHISAKGVEAEKPAEPIITEEEGNAAIDVELERVDTLEAGVHVYRVLMSDLRVAKEMPEVYIENLENQASHLTGNVAFELPAYYAISRDFNLGAKQVVIRSVEKNMVDGVDAKYDYAYIKFECQTKMVFSMRMKNVHEGDKCKNATEFNWTLGHRQDANSTVWYDIDITEAKAEGKNLIITLENLSSASAKVTAEVATECPYTDLQSLTRTMAAGAKMTRTIEYGMFGMLATDHIYVGVTTDQKIKLSGELEEGEEITPDPACEDAINFDMKNGVSMPAGEQWYLVDLRALKADKTMVPTILVKNLGEGKATITGTLATECPVTKPTTSRTQTIAAGSYYKQEIARTMIDGIANDTLYIKVVSDQDITIEVTTRELAAGETCQNPIAFNWSLGNDHPAGAELWYQITMADGNIGLNDLEVSLKNKSGNEVTVDAAYAFDCDNLPQTQSVKLAAREEKTKLLPNSMVADLDIVLVRIKSAEALHLSAKLVDPAPFDPIDCDALTITDVEVGTPVAAAAGETWLRVPKTVLNQINSESVPVITYKNLTAAQNTLVVDEAYKCPITSTMVSNTRKLAANGEFVDRVESSLAVKMAERDFILYHITADAAYEFTFDLVNPNVGTDANHAIRVRLDSTYVYPANTVVWYRLDIGEIKAVEDLVYKNIVAGASVASDSKVKVALYNERDLTDDLLMEKGEYTLKSGRSNEKSAPAYFVRALESTVFYARVECSKSFSFYSRLTDRPAGPAYDICDIESATTLYPGIKYELKSGSQWVALPSEYVRENYELNADATMTVTNPNATDVKVHVSGALDCQFDYQMADATRKIGAGKSYTKTLTEAINSAVHHFANRNFEAEDLNPSFIETQLRNYLAKDVEKYYLLLELDGDLVVDLEALKMTRGDDCGTPVNVKVNECYDHEAGTDKWYLIEINDGDVPADKDLSIEITNLSSLNHSQVDASISFDCLEAPIVTRTREFVEDEIVSIPVSHEMIDSISGNANILLHLTTTEDTRVCLKLVDPYVCEEWKTTIDTCVYEGELFTYDTHNENEEVISFTIVPGLSDTTVVLEERPSGAIVLCEHEYIFNLKQYTLPTFNETLSRKVACGELLDYTDIKAAVDAAQAGFCFAPVVTYTYDNGTAVTVPVSTDAATVKLLVTIKPYGYDEKGLEAEEYEFTYVVDHFKMPVLTDDMISAVCGAPIVYTAVKTAMDAEVARFTGEATVTYTFNDAATNEAQTGDEAKLTVSVSTKCGDESVDLTTTVEHFEMPALTDDMISAMCGDTVVYADVKATVDAAVEAFLAKGGVASAIYTVNDAADLAAIMKGSDNEAKFSVVVTTPCGDETKDLVAPIEHSVDTVTFAADKEMLVNKYHRILLLNLGKNGMNMSEEEANLLDLHWWYLAPDATEPVELTNFPEPGNKTRYYIKDGDNAGGILPEGEYFVTIGDGFTLNEYGCDVVTLYKGLPVLPVADAPRLSETMLAPGQEVDVLNLDPVLETIVKVYDVRGGLLTTYKTSGAETMSMKAAANSGYYMVEVQNMSVKATLRYIVK